MAAAKHEHQHQQHSSAHGGGHHFLVVAFGTQSHVNPGRALAHRLARLSRHTNDGRPILATLSVPIAAHRRLFPTQDGNEDRAPEAARSDGVISYVPHCDGWDDDGRSSKPKTAEDWARRRRVVADSLSAIVTRFADAGTPVTCIVLTMLGAAVVDVATRHAIPFAVYWIQPATVLAVEYHYFHGAYDDHELVAAGQHAAVATDDDDGDDPTQHEVISLPGLSRPLRIRDFPSFLLDAMTGGSVPPASTTLMELFRELFESMDQWRPKVLVNTIEELEANVLDEMKRHLDVLVVGPMVGGSSTDTQIHLFQHDDDVDKKRYMEWLGAHPDSSVVYVSFGSVTKVSRRQMDEVASGLRRCGRPYLLVVRKDGVDDGDGDDDGDDESSSHGGSLESENTQQQGMVVDWCDQMEVLSHPAVGCFVSHCGWNSTVEAMASGVPIVCVPNAFDQPTNAYLVEEEWEIGVRGGRDSDGGVVTGTELARCIELVMGDGAKAVAMRERMKRLKEMAEAAASTGGSVERNLREFVRTFQASS